MIKAQTTTGTLKTTIQKLDNGKYQAISDYYDKEGNYQPFKSSIRVADSIQQLIKG